MAKNGGNREQGKTEFIPSRKMLNYLKSFLKAPVTWHNEQIYEDANVSRSTVWAWRRNNDFVEWFNNQTDKWFKGEVPVVHKRIHKRTYESDKAGKLFMERFDEKYREKGKEGNVNIFISERMSKLSDDELKEIIGKRNDEGQEASQTADKSDG